MSAPPSTTSTSSTPAPPEPSPVSSSTAPPAPSRSRNLTVSTNGATGVRLNNAGTVSFAAAGNISITTASAAGLLATGGGATGVNMGTSEFDAITVTGSGTRRREHDQHHRQHHVRRPRAHHHQRRHPRLRALERGHRVRPRAGTQNVSATGGPAVDVTGTTVSTLAFEAVSSANSINDGINLAGLGAGTFTATSGTITGAERHRLRPRRRQRRRHLPGRDHERYREAPPRSAGARGGTVTLSGPITETGDLDTTTENGGIAVTGNSGGSTVVSNATKTFNTRRGPRDRHGHERRPHAHPLRRQPRHRHHERPGI